MHDLELFDANPTWRVLLQAYADRRSGESPWTPRIEAVEQLDRLQLSAVHGRLIALGLLKFDLGADGMSYQLTPLGRHALLPPEKRSPLAETALDEAA